MNVSKSENDFKSDTGIVTVENVPPESEGGTGIPDSEETETKQVVGDFVNDTGEAFVGNVSENQTFNVNVSGSEGESSIESIKFKALKDSKDVKVVVKELKDKPKDLESAGGEVYKYNEIYVVNLEDESLESVSMVFKVEKSFLRERGIGLWRMYF